MLPSQSLSTRSQTRGAGPHAPQAFRTPSQCSHHNHCLGCHKLGEVHHKPHAFNTLSSTCPSQSLSRWSHTSVGVSPHTPQAFNTLSSTCPSQSLSCESQISATGSQMLHPHRFVHRSHYLSHHKVLQVSHHSDHRHLMSPRQCAITIIIYTITAFYRHISTSSTSIDSVLVNLPIAIIAKVSHTSSAGGVQASHLPIFHRLHRIDASHLTFTDILCDWRPTIT